MNHWLLPEHVADALPQEAAQIEHLRRTILDLFRAHAYELVMPPLLEYLNSLLMDSGSGSDLSLRTFKLVDQLSGRTLGVRADMTPQVARIDAHLLNRQGITRLCYCDSVLHTLPASLGASREPVQLGAELYGYGGIMADIEIIRLMNTALLAGGAAPSRIDVSHVGVFRALVKAAKAANLSEEQEDTLLICLQQKDNALLRDVCQGLAEPWKSAFLHLSDLYGDKAILQAAARLLPKTPEIHFALHTMEKISEALTDLPLSFDLSDLSGYRYHTGIVFSAYHTKFPAAIARGGRYDGIGRHFGRARPATGFSMDLREVARLLDKPSKPSAIVCRHTPPDAALQGLQEAIDALRAQGKIVCHLLPDEGLSEAFSWNQQLRFDDGKWLLHSL